MSSLKSRICTLHNVQNANDSVHYLQPTNIHSLGGKHPVLQAYISISHPLAGSSWFGGESNGSNALNETDTTPAKSSLVSGRLKLHMFLLKKQPLAYTSSLGVTKESTGGSTKPEIAFDANLSKLANNRG